MLLLWGDSGDEEPPGEMGSLTKHSPNERKKLVRELRVSNTKISTPLPLFWWKLLAGFKSG